MAILINKNNKIKIMGKVIVYKGHPTRGAEVIKALEDLGGKNYYNCSGMDNHYFYLNRDNNIVSILDKRMVFLDYCEVRELEPKLPTTLLEVHKLRNPETFFDEDSIKTLSWIAKLQLLKKARDIYNNGWQPNWENDCSKYVITFSITGLTKNLFLQANEIFAFKDKNTRDLFLENFREELTEVLTELYK